MKSLGEKIKELRRIKGASQEELSEALDVSRQTVYRWEKNSAQPTADNIRALSEFFDIDTNYFFEDNQQYADNGVAVTVGDRAVANDSETKTKSIRKLVILTVISVVLLLAIVVSLIFTIGSGLIVFSGNTGYQYITSWVVDKSVFFIFVTLSIILFAIEIIVLIYLKDTICKQNVT